MDAFMQHLAGALNQPDLAITPGSRLRDLPNWDSLAILTTISMIDQEYDVMLSGTDLQASETVADLYNKVRAAKPDA
jgi:acyl carrier protein